MQQAYEHLGVKTSEMAEVQTMHLDFQSKNLHLIESFPQAAPALLALKRAQFKMGVVSNRRENVGHLLLHCGLLEYMDLVLGAEHVSNPKPHPEGIFKAMLHFESSPEETAFVGDTQIDVQAGKAAGVRTIAIDGSDCLDELKAAQPDHLIKNLTELLPLLAQ